MEASKLVPVGCQCHMVKKPCQGYDGNIGRWRDQRQLRRDATEFLSRLHLQQHLHLPVRRFQGCHPEPVRQRPVLDQHRFQDHGVQRQCRPRHLRGKRQHLLRDPVIEEALHHQHRPELPLLFEEDRLEGCHHRCDTLQHLRYEVRQQWLGSTNISYGRRQGNCSQLMG